MTVTERDRAYMTSTLSESRVNLEFETEGMTLNMGPQHPATHGTLRIVVKLDGEQVISCDPVMGYMHRGYEKLCEVRTYPQINTFVNRIDWLGRFANGGPFVLPTQAPLGGEAPRRRLYRGGGAWPRPGPSGSARSSSSSAAWPTSRCSWAISGRRWAG